MSTPFILKIQSSVAKQISFAVKCRIECYNSTVRVHLFGQRWPPKGREHNIEVSMQLTGRRERKRCCKQANLNGQNMVKIVKKFCKIAILIILKDQLQSRF